MKRSGVLVLLLLLPMFTLGNSPAQKTGPSTVRFEEYSPLSSLAEIIKRTKIQPTKTMDWGHHYRIQDESFEVYVPKGYNAKTPFGLFVWISPGDQGTMNPEWYPLMDKFRLLFVGANRSGNEHDVYTRRIPLALDALHNMKQKYIIDPKRVYIAGLSGGGRVSSHIAVHYSDLFTGGLFIIGCDYWKPVPVPEKPGYFFPQGISRPQQKYLSKAMHEGRYVLLTGEKDANRLQMFTYYQVGFSRYFDNAWYIQVNGMGHEPPPLDWMEKAIAYIANATGP